MYHLRPEAKQTPPCLGNWVSTEESGQLICDIFFSLLHIPDKVMKESLIYVSMGESVRQF